MWSRKVLPDLCREIYNTWGQGAPFWTYKYHYNFTRLQVQKDLVMAEVMAENYLFAEKKFRDPFLNRAIKQLKLIAIQARINSKNPRSPLTSSEESDNASDCEIIEPDRGVINISDDEQECENSSKRQKTENGLRFKK